MSSRPGEFPKTVLDELRRVERTVYPRWNPRLDCWDLCQDYQENGCWRTGILFHVRGPDGKYMRPDMRVVWWLANISLRLRFGGSWERYLHSLATEEREANERFKREWKEDADYRAAEGSRYHGQLLHSAHMDGYGLEAEDSEGERP